MPYKNREDQRAAQKRYAQRNKEKLRDKARNYYRSNKERLNELHRKRRAANPERYEAEKKKAARDLMLLKREINKKLVQFFGGKCQICGIPGDPCIFDFHHLNPDEKEVNMAGLICRTRDWDTLVTEGKKCALLCSNCHRMVHRGLADLGCSDESTFEAA